MGWIDIIGDPRFINFLSTFGLAVFLVLYFALWRNPRQAKFQRERDEKQTQFWRERDEKQTEDWRQRYNSLLKNYELLRENYIRLEEDLRPESRMCSDEQAGQLADVGLDRDLYKLYYLICQKMEGKRTEKVRTFIEDSIRKTNKVWSKFKSPFPRVERISDLYGVYTNNGESLTMELEELLKEEIRDEEKKAKLWNSLFANTVNMKREFEEFINAHNNGKEIRPYCERAETAKK